MKYERFCMYMWIYIKILTSIYFNGRQSDNNDMNEESRATRAQNE